MTISNNTRIAWVDVFKFLGIWAIYIGHFGEAAGKVYPFVFTYHVPMFFFAAGFFAFGFSGAFAAGSGSFIAVNCLMSSSEPTRFSS